MFKAGYTLLEIMVAIAIFALMLAYSVVNLRGVNESDKVKLATDKIVSALRIQRNSAFNGVIDPSANINPEGGYGVYFNRTNNTMVRFADWNSDGLYDASNETMETVQFDEDVQISPSGVSVLEMTVIFDGEDEIFLYNQTGCGIPCSSPPSQSALDTYRQVEVKDTTTGTCTGNITFPQGAGVLYIESSITGC